MSEADWLPTMIHSARAGGQGSVTQVRHLITNIVGAKKSLLIQHLHSSERRGRMAQEVLALKMLSGIGTPRWFDDNTEAWEQRDVPLYVVLEWVEGPTLAQKIDGQPVDLDAALAVAFALLETLVEVNDKGIVHRDIKPDNIILRDGDLAKPCLVDFGMSWTETDEEPHIETSTGQEIGNRFLRLPEHAAGHHVRDARSDTTMVAGVMFYLLTGRAPRVLVDAEGRLPHERGSIPETLAADRRWTKLQRVFGVAFQPTISLRYGSASELADRLRSLEPDEPAAGMSAAMGRLRRIIESPEQAAQLKAANGARLAMSELLTALQSAAAEHQLAMHVPGMIMNPRLGAAVATVFLSTPGTQDKLAGVDLQIDYSEGRFMATYVMRESHARKTFFESSAADAESLKDTCVRESTSILQSLVQLLAAKLEEQRDYPVIRELNISRDAARIGLLLSERSEGAFDWDPRILIMDLQQQLNLDQNQSRMAINEMARRGFIQMAVHDAIGATRELFFAFDKHAKGWSPKSDALIIARRLVAGRDGQNAWTCERMGQTLGWPPRRMNAAVQYLLSRDAVVQDSNSVPGWLMHWLEPSESTQKLVDAG